MPRIAILKDPAITPPPGIGPDNNREAFRIDGAQPPVFISRTELASLSRASIDVVILPYLEGDLTGPPLEGLLRFHEQGGGLVFLGDTPSEGCPYPFRYALAPDLHLAKCRDVLSLDDFTPEGRHLLGPLPPLGAWAGRPVGCVRTSAYPPDQSTTLVRAVGHLKDMGPVVLVERRHPRFLGARLAIAGFDGGEPRENIMGVAQLPWQPDYGLLDPNWPGLPGLIRSLTAAVVPATMAVALDVAPVADAGTKVPVTLRIRNLDTVYRTLTYTCSSEPDHRFAVEGRVDLEPGSTAVIPLGFISPGLGPTRLSAAVFDGTPEPAAAHHRMVFGGLPPRPGCLGFSTYRAFRDRHVDASFREFLQRLAALGMQYVRMALPWEDLEPTPGHYDWALADEMIEAAERAGLTAYLWVFPTALGSGLGDGGLPAWALQEPAIDHEGRPGNFPCIWSPFYRQHYFNFLAALTRRYADDPRVSRFIYDFGNSDFAYTYHYYGDRGDRFDYAPQEQRAFADWLNHQQVPLDEIARRWGQPYARHDDVPVPRASQTEAWLLYDQFRVWGVHQGIKEAAAIITRIAPDKAPPDHPGHGLGSISDIQTYVHHAQAKHWDEVQRHPAHLVEAHNMGRIWGGEAWQVGGTYSDYDDALFQSVRLEADYFTVPGPDLGIWEEQLARLAMIRRSLSNYRRSTPRIAILDHLPWHQFNSLAQLGTRLDQPVDLLSRTCRYDYTTYDLLVLPPVDTLATEKGITSILPGDEDFHNNLHDAVLRGLRVVVFPETGCGDPGNPFRRICGLDGVTYGPEELADLDYPEAWGGGQGHGIVRTVQAGQRAEPWLTTRDGRTAVAFLPCGRGGYILCGYGRGPGSPDEAYRYDASPHLREHTLVRLLKRLDLGATELDTGQTCCWKERLHNGEETAILLYSHQAQAHEVHLTFSGRRTWTRIMDLATGYTYPLTPSETSERYSVKLGIEPRRGYYFVLLNE